MSDTSELMYKLKYAEERVVGSKLRLHAAEKTLEMHEAELFQIRRFIEDQLAKLEKLELAQVVLDSVKEDIDEEKFYGTGLDSTDILVREAYVDALVLIGGPQALALLQSHEEHNSPLAEFIEHSITEMQKKASLVSTGKQ